MGSLGRAVRPRFSFTIYPIWQEKLRPDDESELTEWSPLAPSDFPDGNYATGMQSGWRLLEEETSG